MSRRLFVPVLLLGFAVASLAATQQNDQPKFFHISPVRPVSELKAEALEAWPPIQSMDTRTPDLVELTTVDSSIKLDIRYATANNFLSTPIYDEARAFMQRPAAEAVARASRKLHDKGYGLLIHDAYRPWYVTKIFWDATPADKHQFVADPSLGSRHNRACAVDLTLYDLKTGQPVPMPSLYDEMSERAYPDYKGGTDEERRNRQILRDAMEAEGFKVYEFEWWHFDYDEWNKYPVLNITFDNIPHGGIDMAKTGSAAGSGRPRIPGEDGVTAPVAHCPAADLRFTSAPPSTSDPFAEFQVGISPTPNFLAQDSDKAKEHIRDIVAQCRFDASYKKGSPVVVKGYAIETQQPVAAASADVPVKSGTATVEISCNSLGRVSAVKVVRSTGDRELDQIARTRAQSLGCPSPHGLSMLNSSTVEITVEKQDNTGKH